MKQLRRWISCLLVFCVVISMLPVIAFAETTEISSGTCGENLTWTLDEAGTLTISGKGDMDDWNDTNTTPWINYLDTIQTVVINDGVTSIGSFAFADCHTLSNVKIPQSVTSFGEVAFLHCFWLNEITIPKAVTHLDVNPFAGCKNLTFIEIESGNENYCTDEFGGVYTKDYSQLIAYPAGRTGSYTVNAKTSTIGSAAFYLCGDLTDITLSENITSIGHDAFAFCGNLENVIIPEKVTNVDDYAFSGCEKLTEVVFKGRAPKFGQDLFSGITTTCFYPIDDPTWTSDVMQNYGGTITWVSYEDEHTHEFGDDDKCACGILGGTCGNNLIWTLDAEGVLTISGSGKMADYSNSSKAPWYSYKEKITSAVIESGVTSIGAWSLEGCINMNSVIIPEGTISIGNYVFWNCNSLVSVTIPDSVTSIGEEQFASCSDLSGIWVGEGNPNYSSDPYGVLFNKDKSVLIRVPATVEQYHIPDRVTHIEDNAFDLCKEMTSVTIPDSVTTIGDYAFWASGLTSVEIPASVTTIGNHALCCCRELTEIWVDANNPNYSNDECGVLFNKNKTVIIQAPGAIKQYTIPNSVNTIGDYAFGYCFNLSNITIPDSVINIGGLAFYDCENLTSVTIPESVTVIGGDAFNGCSGLIAITIPDSVTRIERCTFQNCRSLTSVIIPDSVTTIGYYSFGFCNSLPNIIIPNSVTKIGASAFTHCPSLTDITFEGSAPVFDSDVFFEVTATAYYPVDDSTWTSNVKQNYGGNITWVAYDPCGNGHSYGADHKCTICGIIGGICGENLIWEFDEETGTLTIKGTGPMYDYADGAVDGKTTPPWADGERDRIKHVVVEEGVTTISDAAFCGFEQIQSVSIANTVESIGGIAFEYCYSLENLVLPDSITSIGVSAFLDCCQLSSVVIGSGVKAIGGYAFGGCSSLKTITFSGNAPSFGDEPNAVFSDVSATARYPAGNPTWTSNVMKDYGGDITWEAYCPGHVFGEWITEGHNSSRICILCGFAEHKVTTDGGDVEIEIPEQPDLDVDVDPIEPTDEEYILVEEALDNEAEGEQEILKVFDINLKNEDGVHVQPNGTVKVKLPLDRDKNGNYKVYRVNDDGTLTDMNAYRQGSHMVFETDHFSLYVIVEEAEHQHNYQSVVTAPTCTEKGYTTYTCTCGDTYTADEVDALGHSWDAGKVTKEPTENETGIRTYTCTRSNCGETKTETIPALEHTHSYTTKTTAPTCSEKGHTTYTCTCGDTYTADEVAALGHKYENGACTVCGAPDPNYNEAVIRLSGKNRYETSFQTADALKEILGVETFDNIVVAYGRNFADALAGSYLATELNAPILLTEDSVHGNVVSYIKENLSKGGKVYILGGTATISTDFSDRLDNAGIRYERLSGKNRYLTNLEILKTAGLNSKTILVCTGTNFADSLSASAANLPILLVGNNLSADQKDYLSKLSGCSFCIIGGANSVSESIAEELRAYGTVDRISGKTRETTSVLVAEAFCLDPDTVTLAYSRNYPDGLCGGPLAYQLGAPLLLVNSGAEALAADYVAENEIASGIVLGGTSSISQETASKVFGN